MRCYYSHSFQVRNLIIGQVKWNFQCQTTGKWLSWDLNLLFLTLSPVLLPTSMMLLLCLMYVLANLYLLNYGGVFLVTGCYLKYLLSISKNCVCVCVCLVSQLCLTLCTMGYSPPGSSVHRILQAKILEWVAISYSRGPSRPRQTLVSFIAGRFFTSDPYGLPFSNSWNRFSWNIYRVLKLARLGVRLLQYICFTCTVCLSTLKGFFNSFHL